MSFLIRNGFDHKLPLTEGVQYLSRHEESVARKAIMIEDNKEAEYPDLKIKSEDQAVINHIRTSIEEWRAKPADQRPDYLNLPVAGDGNPSKFNNYQIRLTHQIVRNEFSGLETRGRGSFVEVTAPTSEETLSQRQILAEQREQDLNRAIGFRWIIEAIFGGNISNMPPEIINAGIANVDLQGKTPQQYVVDMEDKLRNRTKVLVGHNCFGDLVYLYECFIGPSPELIEDFVSEIKLLCPAVIDTKHIASFANRYGDTSLARVEAEMQQESLPKIIVPSEYDRYTHLASYHEAGFDALLTANALIRLSTKVLREQKYAQAAKAITTDTTDRQFGENDLFVSAVASVSDLPKEGSDNIVLQAVAAPIKAVKSLLGMSTPEKPNDGVDRVRKQLESSNPYSVLDSAEDASMPKESEDTVSSSLKAQGDFESVAEAGDLEGMVNRGELMPRWDDASGFWKILGNRLQANACKEGICFLD